MAKKKEAVEEVVYDKGVVLYSDGGCRGNGFAGWGIHGYHYEMNPNPKGSGNTTQVLTDAGYVPKKEKTNDTKIVNAINYIDGFGSIGTYASNNAAEILGAAGALFTASKYDIKQCTLYTDSKYVVDGLNSYLPRWKKNNWIKSDGTEVANKSEWMQLDEQYQKITSNVPNVSVNWIKAHVGHVGNECADKMATLGVFNAMSGKVRSETDYLPASGYWTTTIDRHPFLNIKKAYFLTREDSNTPGHYFLSDHNNKDDVNGVLQTDGSLAYVELNEPAEILEEVIRLQRSFAPGTDIITYVNLNKIFNGIVARDINRFGNGALYRNHTDRIDLYFADSEPVTRGMVPPKLAMRTIEGINNLCGILQQYKDNNTNDFKYTEITDQLFVLNNKNKVVLNEDITQTTDKLTCEIQYGINENDKFKLSLFFGSDIPSRNTLKKIEGMNPVVKIVTWMESENCFRYATIISVDNGIGIWSSIASNLKYIDEVKGKNK